MGWFNYYGLIAIIVIMIPNIIVSFLDKSAFENKYSNKFFLITEQAGRYGCMVFMVFNIPYTYFGFFFINALQVYLIIGGLLLLAYCVGWAIFRRGKSKAKMLFLSITPTILFLFCGVMVSSIPLILCSIIFGIGHITISYKNAE